MNLRALVEIPSFAISTLWKGFSTMASIPNNGPKCKNARRTKLIGTHSGVFHCDEALACFMLQQLPEYSDAEIIRTRDLSILEKCDIVVDVGGEYDPKTHRYDHHQRSFVHTLSSVRPDLAKNKFISIKVQWTVTFLRPEDKKAKWNDLQALTSFLVRPDAKDFYRHLTYINQPEESEDEYVDDPPIDA